MTDERGERIDRCAVLLQMLLREVDVMKAEHEAANAPRQPISVTTHDGSAVPEDAPVVACVDEPPSVSA